MSFSRFRILPRSLAARTALVLLAGLIVVQTVGLAIHALDRLDFARLNDEREIGGQVATIYRTIAETDPPVREAELQKLRLPSGFHAFVSTNPIIGQLRPAEGGNVGRLRRHLQFMPIASRLRPLQIVIANNTPGGDASRSAIPPRPTSPSGGPPADPGATWRPLRQPGSQQGRFDGRSGGPSGGFGDGPPLGGRGPEFPGPPPGQGRRFAIAMQFPDDQRWLTVRFVMPFPDPFLSPTLPVAFLVMTIAAGLLSVWAVRRLTAPLRTLAIAAEKLGRDVNADPLPENGPTEVATAAIAFNTMASRIRRFVTDRTLLLTAIGHDLRTPITRLKLRAEFIDDEELQAKFLADLDELEAMVSATLAFGRDSANREPMVSLDLRSLLQTVLDDAVDGRPQAVDRVGFASPPPSVTLQARPLALKRALANLVGNALAYAGGVQVTLRPPADGHVTVLFEDDGPGIAAEELDRVFEPFVRIETSRNRETGGTGLGLSIARNIVRGQGGDITLANRAPHGLRATVTLVA
ncbi:ATP-binding protein [Lichenicola sp.]|uniref:ATP-binding protein n=1 Tax=Lichenicola sp. TaxID=2804529 RepID=UPI003AFFBC30